VLEYENALFDGHVSLPAVGSYHFGKHVIAFDPPEDDPRLVLYCVFDGFNLDRCDGYIAHEGSMETCAELVFVRQNGMIRLILGYNVVFDRQNGMILLILGDNVAFV